MAPDERYLDGVLKGLELAESILSERDVAAATKKLEAMHKYIIDAKKIYSEEPVHAC